MARATLSAVQSVVDNRENVASAINTLMSTHLITDDDIKDVEVTTFGTNMFLIVITYTTYIEQVYCLANIGGTPTLARIFLAKNPRDLTDAIGLATPIMSQGLYTTGRSFTPLLGLSSTIARTFAEIRSLKPTLGLTPICVAGIAKVPWKSLVGLTSTQTKTLAMKRDDSAKIGLSLSLNGWLNGTPVAVP